MSYKKHRLVRVWSNHELQKVAPLIAGSVLNVSGWNDEDKEGGVYRHYFLCAKRYYISNISSVRGRSYGLNIDLEKDVPEGYVDACFCHTVLEHIFSLEVAFRNLCKLSNDIVIVVVPFCQEQHELEDIKDFWRFTPTCLRELFNRNNMSIVYESASPYRDSSIYLFFVASKRPELWKDIMPKFKPILNAGLWIGESLTTRLKRFLKGNHDSETSCS